MRELYFLEEEAKSGTIMFSMSFDFFGEGRRGEEGQLDRVKIIVVCILVLTLHKVQNKFSNFWRKMPSKFKIKTKRNCAQEWQEWTFGSPWPGYWNRQLKIWYEERMTFTYYRILNFKQHIAWAEIYSFDNDLTKKL